MNLCLKHILVAALTALLSLKAQAASPLNVLFIYCDDLNTDLGTYGHPQVKSPNIDRLASSGVKFSNAFAQWPACLPSRYSLLSGWTCPRIGVKDFNFTSRDGALKDAMYLPQWFKTNGYTTVRIDKVFHPGGDDPACWSFSEEPVQLSGGHSLVHWLGLELQVLGLDGGQKFWLGEKEGFGSPVAESGRIDTVNGEKGIYYIMRDKVPEDRLFDGNTAARGQMYLEKFARSKEPFYLALGFRRPHLPFIANQRYFDLYPPEKIQLPPEQPGYKKSFSDEEHKKLIRSYYAAVSFADAQVGKVLKTLEETGLAANTLVILIGDNGYALGERDGWFGKGWLWDRALKIPCIIAAPNQVKKNLQIDSVVSLTDLYPTIVDLAGLKRPGIPLDGQSMVKLLNGDSTGWRNTAVSHTSQTEWPRVGGSIRTDRWRYNENGDGKVELFDVKKDPYEWNNLANDPACAGMVEELSIQVAESFKSASPSYLGK